MLKVCLIVYKHAVKYAGLSGDWYMKLVGFGCDGTSVNIGDRGLKDVFKRNISLDRDVLVPRTLT